MKKLTYLLLLFTISYYSQGQNNLYDYDVEERISELGIELHIPNLPPGINIELATKSGNLVYLSGNGPSGDEF